MLDSACPAPVTVSMREAACTYRRRATAAMENTQTPWVYSSGLFGQGRIALGLNLQPGIALPRRDAACAVDGRIDDACWQDLPAVAFQNSPFSMLGAAVDFRVFRDAENVYFGYRSRPAAGSAGDADKARIAAGDRLEIYVADAARSVGIHLVIGRNGTASATFGTVGTSRKIDPRWDGPWKSAVQETAEGWTAEVALPLSTLAASGMELKRLQLNCMAHCLTPSGAEAVFLTDPRYGTKFTSCVGFLRVVPAALEPPQPRSFTVRLHFAEIEAVSPGQRVFDVALQDRTVWESLDIVREAGGRNRALVKEFTGIQASDEIVIELTSKGQPGAGNLPPVINGVEILEKPRSRELGRVKNDAQIQVSTNTPSSMATSPIAGSPLRLVPTIPVAANHRRSRRGPTWR